MEFTDCYTWSDLDAGHEMKVMSDKVTEIAPYLAGKVSKGDVFKVVKIYLDHNGRKQTILKGNGIEFMIPEKTDNYFYWRY